MNWKAGFYLLDMKSKIGKISKIVDFLRAGKKIKLT